MPFSHRGRATDRQDDRGQRPNRDNRNRQSNTESDRAKPRPRAARDDAVEPNKNSGDRETHKNHQAARKRTVPSDQAKPPKQAENLTEIYDQTKARLRHGRGTPRVAERDDPIVENRARKAPNIQRDKTPATDLRRGRDEPKGPANREQTAPVDDQYSYYTEDEEEHDLGRTPSMNSEHDGAEQEESQDDGPEDYDLVTDPDDIQADDSRSPSRQHQQPDAGADNEFQRSDSRIGGQRIAKGRQESRTGRNVTDRKRRRARSPGDSDCDEEQIDTLVKPGMSANKKLVDQARARARDLEKERKAESEASKKEGGDSKRTGNNTAQRNNEPKKPREREVDGGRRNRNGPGNGGNRDADNDDKRRRRTRTARH